MKEKHKRKKRHYKKSIAIIAGIAVIAALGGFNVTKVEAKGKRAADQKAGQFVSSILWSSYEKVDDFVYMHDFMASRAGQGYHWWIYLEITYILCDYGGKVGYDFTLDHWTVERIYPIDGGYYNAVISQNNHDVSMDLLFQPEEGKYVVLYARYEDGDRIAGVNQIPYASQLAWKDFDLEEDYHVSVINPFDEICETSVSTVLRIALSHYGQENGYSGEWQVRELFGRSPFFDYLVESESGLLWVCVDIGQHAYTCVPFEV